MRKRCLKRQIAEKEVVALFAMGSAVLLAASLCAEWCVERRAAEAYRRASASAVAVISRRTYETRNTAAVSAIKREPSPTARAAAPGSAGLVRSSAQALAASSVDYRLSDAERKGYFSLIAALDIQGKPEEFAHIFMGTIRQESSFNPRAKHPVSGARGLSQLMADTGAAYGLSRSEFFEPVPNLQAFVKYFYANVKRFTNFSGIDSAGKRATITRNEAINYSLIAHNLGPSALEALMDGGYCEEKADTFIRLLKKRIAKNEPQRYRNKYSNSDEMVTVSKMIEVVDFYGRIMAYSGLYRTVLSRDDDPSAGRWIASNR